MRSLRLADSICEDAINGVIDLILVLHTEVLGRDNFRHSFLPGDAISWRVTRHAPNVHVEGARKNHNFLSLFPHRPPLGIPPEYQITAQVTITKL
jgi:hypothetical protein